MNSERTIIKKWKMHIYGLIIIVLVQCMAFPLLTLLLREFVGPPIDSTVSLIIVLIFIAADSYFLFIRVILPWSLLHKMPVQCILEDIFLVGYKDDNKTRYAPFPIVRSLRDQKLYLAYDKYSLLGFNTRFNYSDRRNVLCTVYKGNGKPVQLGDTVNMYILRTVDIPVSIDRLKNIVTLKHRKIYFRHMNNQLDIDLFTDVTFFKGIVDLDVDIF